jgi:hypothetical protein
VRPVPRWLVAVPLAALVFGVVWVTVFQTLLGALVVIATVMALGGVMLPSVVERIARFLSAGR